MTKEEIYTHMVECEFADGKPCAELYGRVYDARLRLAERTGISFEDRDLVDIIEGLEKIGELCALKMFDYGTRYAAQ